MSDLTVFWGVDGRARCAWCEAPGFAEYQRYHDEEWGLPVLEDRRLFEKICLEGFQAGLSWRTILAKRPAFRAAFANFDFQTVATFTDKDVARLLQDVAIVRHRGKIEATIHNAARAQSLIAEAGSLATFFWRYEEASTAAFRGASPMSQRLSKDLRARGWKFVGPTTVYAFMQAMGLVNDHAPGCLMHERVRVARASLKLPT